MKKQALVLPQLAALVMLVSADVQAAPKSVVKVAPGSCAKINEAIEKLPKSGGTVRLGEGTYTCDYPVVLDKDNVSLIGAGPTKTLIKAQDLVPMPVVIIGLRGRKEETVLIPDPNYPINKFPYPARTVRNVKLSGVTIDGNYQAEERAGSTASGKECWQPDHGKTEDCGKDPGYMVRNNGLTIRRSEDIQVSNIVTRGAYSGGIVIEKKNKRLVIEDFVSVENYFDGFAGYETQDSIIRSFKVNNNIMSGISVDVLFERNIVVDGEASFNGDNGIFTADVGHNIYKRLKVIGNKNLGFYIDGEREQPSQKLRYNTCNGNQIVDTVIEMPSKEADTKENVIKEAIMINHACKDTVLQNVSITQRDLKCVTINELASGKAEKVVCKNESVKKVVGGALPNVEGFNVFREPNP